MRTHLTHRIREIFSLGSLTAALFVAPARAASDYTVRSLRTQLQTAITQEESASRYVETCRQRVGDPSATPTARKLAETAYNDAVSKWRAAQAAKADVQKRLDAAESAYAQEVQREAARDLEAKKLREQNSLLNGGGTQPAAAATNDGTGPVHRFAAPPAQSNTTPYPASDSSAGIAPPPTPGRSLALPDYPRRAENSDGSIPKNAKNPPDTLLSSTLTGQSSEALGSLPDFKLSLGGEFNPPSASANSVGDGTVQAEKPLGFDRDGYAIEGPLPSADDFEYRPKSGDLDIASLRAAAEQAWSASPGTPSPTYDPTRRAADLPPPTEAEVLNIVREAYLSVKNQADEAKRRELADLVRAIAPTPSQIAHDPLLQSMITNAANALDGPKTEGDPDPSSGISNSFQLQKGDLRGKTVEQNAADERRSKQSGWENFMEDVFGPPVAPPLPVTTPRDVANGVRG